MKEFSNLSQIDANNGFEVEFYSQTSQLSLCVYISKYGDKWYLYYHTGERTLKFDSFDNPYLFSAETESNEGLWESSKFKIRLEEGIYLRIKKF